MLSAAAFDALRRQVVRRSHDKALLSAVARLGNATTRDVLSAYYATPLERHVGERMVRKYLRRLRTEGKLRGERMSLGRYGATTIYTVAEA